MDKETEEKVVTISKERYEELLQKEELLEVHIEYERKRREE